MWLATIQQARKEPPRLTMSVTRPSLRSRSRAPRVTPQCTVMKSTPSAACSSITANISSGVMSTMPRSWSVTLTAAW